MKDNFDDFDRSFFDLAQSSRKSSYAPAKKRDTGTAEVTDGQTDDSVPSFRIPPAGRDKPIRTARYSGASFSRHNGRQTVEKPAEAEILREYNTNGTFLKHVCVQSWPSAYNFYEKFVRDAAISHERRGKEAPHVPFFSYIPQYIQLNASQWAYYLYMKECAREGVCLTDADFSYVLLYIYEIINLDGIIPPEEGANILGSVWMLYRRLHPMLDKYMSEWMADYCLIYGIPLPKLLYPILPETSSRSTLKEFFADIVASRDTKSAGKLMRLSLSDYDPARSRYASKIENFVSLTEEVFDSAALEQLRDCSGLFDKKLRRQMTVTRDAFCGSLCASNVKKKIVLTLDTPFRAPETRRLVTEMMKGAENIVRSRVGVKARLAAPILEGKSAAVSARTEEERAYLSFYESPEEALSADAAAKIEHESWRNTELLAGVELAPEAAFEPCDDAPEVGGAISGGGFEEEAENCEDSEAMRAVKANEAFAEDKSVCQGASLMETLGERLAKLLQVAAEGGSFSAACREAGLFADDAASRINECAMDFIGDVILEMSGTDYVFIEDYRDDIE